MRSKNIIYDNEDEYYSYITFNADGTWSERSKIGSSENTASGTWRLNGNTLIMNDGEDDDTTTISINGNTLTMTYEGREDGEWMKEVYTYKKK